MRLTRNIKLAWNGFFLLMAVFFCGLAILVFFFPATINNFAESYKQNYVTQHRVMGEQVIKSLQQGNSVPIQNLLRDDLGEIKKGDRLYPIKRHLLLTLVQQSYKQQEYKIWVKWAKGWYQLDDRDVTAMAYYYAALLQNDEDYEKGMLGLKDASARFPKHLLLRKFYQAQISGPAIAKDQAQDAIN
ncbi:MAG: hypothetical protein HOE45_11180 [Gammaproteobacteria bacterium]|jgi:hypothetical protein|nr:hypothetical protein [Gammaproteobacteria bacterium]MBT4147412.1 hypothetical protein [Gammaproteobacteria bacterium]MBT5221254.1 hypothetical protein [Gammaproteobacteria bacterium]MBT5966932.1 hypothetical protein [Gammaproteobacteria bacterium]MBT6419675.1 hypothetical protein [Gammaproteobacteria bacterium]